MSLDYNVVFEHTQKTGGYAGNRFWTSYRDEADFQARNKQDNDSFKVIAQGVTEEEALNLTSLTPEICRLTAAIEEFCSEDGSINTDTVRFELPQKAFAIVHDRQRREENGLSPESPFTFVDIDSLEDSPKKDLFTYIRDTFPSDDGAIYVDLNLAVTGIIMHIMSIQFKELSSLHKH